MEDEEVGMEGNECIDMLERCCTDGARAMYEGSGTMERKGTLMTTLLC
jgi:hypothetical protein